MAEAILFITTGAALYGGVHHLYHGARNPGGYPHVIHAVMFLLLAGFALAGTTTSLVHSATEFSLYSKLSVSSGLLIYALLPWFITLLLQQRAGVATALISAAWAALLLINITSPYSLLFRQVTEVPFETAANPIWHLVEISMLATLVYGIFLCTRQFQAQDKTVPAIPLAGLLLLTGTTIYDALVYAGLVQTSYLAPMGFLLFLASAGLCWRKTTVVSNHSGQAEAKHYQLTMNFNESPAREQEVAADIPADAETPVTRLTHQPVAQQVIEQSPATPPPLRIDNPMVDRVSDGLVDIAVDASLMLKQLDEGELDTKELKELGRKLRKQAIETRRITHKMLRTEGFGQKADS